MSTSTKSTQLTVPLPEGVLEIVRAKISSGEYANESDVVETALLNLLLPPLPGEEPSDEWLRKEVVPVLDAMNADPSRGHTVEEVLANLRDRHARRTGC